MIKWIILIEWEIDRPQLFPMRCDFKPPLHQRVLARHYWWILMMHPAKQRNRWRGEELSNSRVVRLTIEKRHSSINISAITKQIDNNAPGDRRAKLLRLVLLLMLLMVGLEFNQSQEMLSWAVKFTCDRPWWMAGIGRDGDAVVCKFYQN